MTLLCLSFLLDGARQLGGCTLYGPFITLLSRGRHFSLFYMYVIVARRRPEGKLWIGTGTLCLQDGTAIL